MLVEMSWTKILNGGRANLGGGVQNAKSAVLIAKGENGDTVKCNCSFRPGRLELIG